MDRASSQPSYFHLGNNVYAYVRTYASVPKFHIRYFGPSRYSSTSSRLVPTKRGAALDIFQFKKLLQCQKRLTLDYYEQSTAVAAAKSTKGSTEETDNHETNLPSYSEEEDTLILPDTQPAEAAEKDEVPTKKRKRAST